MIFTAFFTNNGVPATGLTPTIKFKDVNSGTDITATITGGVTTLTEVGDGFYQYTLNNYTGSQSYAVVVDGGIALQGRERYYVSANENYLEDIHGAKLEFYSTGSIGKNIFNTNVINSGRYKVENNQIIIYKNDNSTEIMRFNIFDSNGLPINNSINVFERRKS